jgi:hypothetical protein
MWSALSDERTRLSFTIAAGPRQCGSESRETRDHILPSQVRDFSFRRLYDSQGYGGSIRPRLYISARTTYVYETQLFYCVRVCCGGYLATGTVYRVIAL